MARSFIVLAAALAAGAALAQAVDPLDSAACRRALAALQSQEDATAASNRAGAMPDPPVPAPALLNARRDAARACLGSTADATPRQRYGTPALSVPPVAVAPLAASQAMPPAPVLPPPRPKTPTRHVIACDSDGCSLSDGSRLPRIGLDLLGPRGRCTLHGAELRCP